MRVYRPQIMLAICLLVICLAATFCVLDLQFAQPGQPALAADKPEVVISVDDSGEELEWLVTYNQEELLRTSGDWKTGIPETAVSVKILDALRAKLGIDSSKIAGNYCNISFVFPSFEASLENESIDGIYKERDVNVLAAIKAYTVSANLQFEYRTRGSSEEPKRVAPSNYDSFSGCVSFPSSVGAGEYEIRIVASYVTSFELDGEKPIEYTTEVKSNWLECKIAQASANIPKNAEIEITYGNSIKYLISQISSLLADKGWDKIDGSFTLAQKQAESNLAGIEDTAAFYLDTSKVYSVRFDFEPESDSYARDSVTVAVRVNPRPLSIYLDDSFSVEGEPLNNPSYRLDDDSLVADDNVADLGVVFRFVDADGNEIDGSQSGTYRVYADFNNKNYKIDENYSTSDKFSLYGVYNVYKRIRVTLEGDGGISIILSEPVQNATAVAERVYLDEPLIVGDKKCLYAYRIALYDENGDVLKPSSDYIVRWDSLPQGAMWASSESLELIDMAEQGGITLRSEQSTIYFFAAVEPASLPIWVYIVVDIPIALIFVLAVLRLKRRLICKKSYKSYVYQYESAQSNADCDNITATLDGGRNALVGAKKPRHGKSNKQRNGAKKDSRR